MTVFTSWPAAAIALVLAVFASATHAAIPASQRALTGRQQARLDRACHTTMARVQKALMGHSQRGRIRSRLDVVTPGALTGEIAFNSAGSSVSLAGHLPSGTRSSFVCSEATATPRGLGPGHSHVVATLHRSFSRLGRYTLVFWLDAGGRRIVARLAAADRAYREHHPHGQAPPSIAFGIALTYALAA